MTAALIRVPNYTPAVAELKTRATRASVTSFLNSITDEERRADSKALVEMMTKATKAKPVMWGPAIARRCKG